MTGRDERRVAILRALIALDPRAVGVSAIEIADRASLARRGVAQTLNAMSLDGLIYGVYSPDQRIYFWLIEQKGRELAESIGVPDA